jgi:hypothetical protein
MEDEYIYAPLQKGEMRLLEILPGQPDDPLQCHLRTVSLEDATKLPSYAAISYTWGDDLSDRTIMVDGRRLSVKPNLDAALFEFRREPPRLIIDDVNEQALAIFHTPRPFSNRYNESFSTASLADYDELQKMIKACGRALGELSDYDAEHALIVAFVKEAEGLWNQIADREGVLLWIDGICINQNDSTERSAQVRMMGRIYSKAKHLVIWLGPGNKDADATLDILALWKEQGEKSFDTWFTANNPANKRDWAYRDLEMLFATPWFERAWIVQEYVLGALNTSAHGTSSEPVIFCCGTRRIRDLLSNIPSVVDFLRNCPGIVNLVNAGRLFGMRHWYKHRRFKTELGLDSFKAVYLLKAVAQSWQCHVTDPRDRIYSCLGLIDAYFNDDFGGYVPAGLIVDYNASVDEVYSSFVRAITRETKRLDILAFCSGTRTSLVQRTWTPDWGHERLLDGILANWIRLNVFPGDYVEGLAFNATPGLQSTASFADDLSTITVSGFICDRLTDDASRIIRRSEDVRNLETAYLLTKGNLIMLWREVTESVWEGLKLDDPETINDNSVRRLRFRRTLLECLKLNSEISESDLEQFGKDLDQSTDLKSLSRRAVNFHNQNHKATEKDTSTAAHRKQVAKLADMHGKTLVLTEGNNVVRPVTDDPRPGDVICVVLGCAVPLLIRPFDGYYEVHGEVYVPGIMHGEAITALEEGKLVLQGFELH